MVDFNQLRASKKQPVPTDPNEIFRRLPKPQGINDLYVSQSQVLEEWYKRRNEQNIVIKLHTGGGKTLVGLLIAQSILNETNEPVIYLSPTTQLVRQTLAKATEYGIPALSYEKSQGFSEDFFGGKKVLICTYQALFNGLSRFGLQGNRDIIHVAGIILDDAHVAFSTVRDQFTLSINKKEDLESYNYLMALFRNDFRKLGRLGTFDDIANGLEYSILEVPYWSWHNKAELIREYLRDKADSYKFVWPFLRDAFAYCHCLISQNAFVITPIFPLIDLIPTFATCQRRIFMSATISDDSDLIRTFDANFESVAKPITSNSLAGVSERMILSPELMKFQVDDIPQMLRDLVGLAANKIGTVILVPSFSAAQLWNEVATVADSSESAGTYIKQLQESESHGPFVFANRYDGIDLPDKACRLLILSDVPSGANEYDLYRMNIFSDGTVFNNTLAQRIEQGIGRGARGANDYCVVIITGKRLIAWLSQAANMKFLTSSTRAQVLMGVEISKNINSRSELIRTINLCFHRDLEWVKYHAETLADLDKPDQINTDELKHADTERKAFHLWRSNNYDKAIAKLSKYYQSTNRLDEQSEQTDKLDEQSKGWLLQFAARIAFFWDRKDLAQELQQRAYGYNNRLIRPLAITSYTPIIKPGKQAKTIVAKIQNFVMRRGYIAEFEEVVSYLVSQASANQFEQALERLGSMLGFSTQRPEHAYGQGPDVLWLVNDNLGLVIEAKSRKNAKNALTKAQHGQLLTSVEWFKKEYPAYSHIPVSVHPNISATKSAGTNESRALTLEKLNELIVNARNLLSELCDSALTAEELVIQCEKLLSASNLKPLSLVEHFLVPFETVED